MSEESEAVKRTRPTVGRIVIYFSFGTPGGEYQSAARARVGYRLTEKGLSMLEVSDGQRDRRGD